MPLRNYKAIKPGRCPHCKDGVELNQKPDEEDVSECPKCGNPIERVAAEVNSPKILRPISSREAKEVGFKVLKKNQHGLYERD